MFNVLKSSSSAANRERPPIRVSMLRTRSLQSGHAARALRSGICPKGATSFKKIFRAATFGMTWRCITCAGVSGHYLCRCLRTLLVPVPQGFWAITPPILVHHQCAVWVPHSRLDGFLTIYVVTSPASHCRRCKPRLRSRENEGLVPHGFPRSRNQPREVPCRPPIRNH